MHAMGIGQSDSARAYSIYAALRLARIVAALLYVRWAEASIILIAWIFGAAWSL